jgi:DNA invertase Pin-like site-specific DNA recombinase
MKIGYARVSTEEQTLNLQTDALQAAGCETICSDEGISGATRNRPGLTDLLSQLKPGDTLVVWKLDRLGRSLPHLLELITGLGDRSIGFRSLSEQIDTSSAGGRLVFHIMGALAEFERSLISERTIAGMTAAKRRGIHVGRPRTLAGERIQHMKELLDQGRSKREVAVLLGVSPNTIGRAVKRSA